ncbi:MAG: DUF2255 family protein [Streptomyces sp.]|nr:DUF2255 family protein [Streptomyces sp.]NUR39769.1 DUF2255 family protein [Streptomyces sp.]NUS29865.1 DUF2255 family protein [Streptomyces sp.]NUS78142.1 DUF2255 family protein [Streptomyces sp.]
MTNWSDDELIRIEHAEDVTFAEVFDSGVNDRVDAAYRTKYGRYGASYVTPMVASRDTTLKLVPR